MRTKFRRLQGNKRANAGLEMSFGPMQLRTSGFTGVNNLLGQSDDDALGAADVGEPIRVLVLHHFADQFGAVGKQTRDDIVLFKSNGLAAWDIAAAARTVDLARERGVGTAL